MQHPLLTNEIKFNQLLLLLQLLYFAKIQNAETNKLSLTESNESKKIIRICLCRCFSEQRHEKLTNEYNKEKQKNRETSRATGG